MSLFWFAVIIGLSIFVHELGHYLAARAQGVKVPAFSVGFGPALLRFVWKETEWRIGLIPLGGYALIEGMVEEEEGPPRGYARLGFWGKALVLVGGVFMNLLLAWLLLGLVFNQRGAPKVVTAQAEIIEVLPQSLAEASGLLPGDVIVAIDGRPLEDYTELTRIKARPGEHKITLLRDGKTETLTLVWREDAKQIGVRYGPRVEMVPLTYPEALAFSVSFTLKAFPAMVKAFVSGITGVISGRPSPDLVGPVGIVAMTGEAARQGLLALAQLAATINLSLAVFNLLPIPGLDGGRLLLLVLGRILPGRLTPEREAWVNFIGLAFVLLLLVMITAQDLGRLFQP